MKLFKKILWLGAILTTCLGFGLGAAACVQPGTNSSTNGSENSTTSETESSVSASDSDSSVEPVEPDTDKLAYVYRVSIQNETGFGFYGVTVNLMLGGELVASKTTNRSGNANFLSADVAQTGVYEIVIEDSPAGYELPAQKFQTSEDTGTQTVIVIKPTGLLQGEAPAGTFYSLGDVMYDFTVTLSDRKKYTLSEVLQEKDLVLLNFWATWCGPCKSEFPAMHNAAIAYESSVSVLAVSTTDTSNGVADFKASNGYEKFNMASAGSGGLATMFNVGNIPHTVMIDRYGVIVYNHVGSMPSVSSFTIQFEKFVGDDYVPTVVGGTTEEDNPSEDNPDVEQMKPIVEAPSTGELKSVFAQASAQSFHFRFQEEDGIVEGDEEYDEYNWPWLISEDKQYIYASNANVHNSYSILYSKMTAKEGDVLTFDYKVGSEKNADIFYVILDGTVIQKYSGNLADGWNTSYAYVFDWYETGEHSVSFVFLKDTETTANGDTVQLRDLRILKTSDLDKTGIDANIFRNAAYVKNTASNATTQYAQYVDVYLGDDEYYHVGYKDDDIPDPVLYANMMNASLWNENSIWVLAFNNYIVGEGMNFRDAIEGYAWEAAQITTVNGYTPVTADLQYLLDAAARYTTFGQKWAGAYHDKEWLEMCVYWEHYGKSDLPDDPLAGISFSGAIPMTVGENAISVPYALNPRGFKYKFQPTVSGAYHVYSTGYNDTIAFLVAGDRTTQLGYWDNKVFVEVVTDEDGNDISDANFEFYWYFEAGETYYMLFTTYLDQEAYYNVNIDYMGETYEYFTNAALGPYSANLNTFELFIPDAIEYKLGDDGYYHHLKKDGSLGSIIYLDVNRPTALFNSISLYDICRQALKYEEKNRAFYINNKDYTPEFTRICAMAMAQSGALQGFIAVDEELFELLQLLTVEKYEGIENTWLMLCYYYLTLDGSGN